MTALSAEGAAPRPCQLSHRAVTASRVALPRSLPDRLWLSQQISAVPLKPAPGQWLQLSETALGPPEEVLPRRYWLWLIPTFFSSPSLPQLDKAMTGDSSGNPCLPRVPKECPDSLSGPQLGPLTHLGLYDGAVQGAVILVVEKAELQGTQGGWSGKRQEPRERSVSHSTNISRALTVCPIWARR